MRTLKTLSWIELVSLILYMFINSLFVIKYSVDWMHPGFGLFIYLSGLIPCYLICRTPAFQRRISRTLYWSVVIGLAGLLTVLMLRFDPSTQVGRYPALNLWLSRLFNGEYPYGPPLEPSGFPFLFILALPFVLVGDAGFMQIAGFLLFAWLIHELTHRNPGVSLMAILMLSTSPAFLYEVATRSELFFNMILVVSWLFWVDKIGTGERRGIHITLGLLGGFVLATRGIVALIFVLYLGYRFRNLLIKGVQFIGWITIGFMLLLIPFYMWDFTAFKTYGPLAIQTSYIPSWVLLVTFLIALLIALRSRSWKQIHFSAGILLFGVALIAFVIEIFEETWSGVIAGDGFDLAYFIFALPFLLIALSVHRAGDASMSASLN